jgi:hypothetical protein
MTFAVFAMARSTVLLEILLTGDVSPKARSAGRNRQQCNNPNANSSHRESCQREMHFIPFANGHWTVAPYEFLTAASAQS